MSFRLYSLDGQWTNVTVGSNEADAAIQEHVNTPMIETVSIKDWEVGDNTRSIALLMDEEANMATPPLPERNAAFGKLFRGKLVLCAYEEDEDGDCVKYLDIEAVVPDLDKMLKAWVKYKKADRNASAMIMGAMTTAFGSNVIPSHVVSAATSHPFATRTMDHVMELRKTVEDWAVL
jgi:hypothetical protein